MRAAIGAIRDRVLTDPRFRSWALAFPLTRPVARRRVRDLFDLCAGFVYSQILFAAVQVRAFDALAAGPATAAELAPRLGLPLAGAERLLRGMVALRLADRRGGRFGLGPLGAAMIGNDGVAAMVEHHALLYADLADPVALLQGEPPTHRLRDYWAYVDRGAAADAGRVAGYSRLMALSQDLIAESVLASFSLRRHRRMLELGGGAGVFAAAAARRWPHLQIDLFDLPAVAAATGQRLAAEGLGGRIATHGGDFRTDALPAGADIVALVRVLHDHDDDSVAAILAAARRALGPGGVLLVAEPLAETPGGERVGDAYFGLYLLAMGSGRPRTAAELFPMMEAAGFRHPRLVRSRLPLLASVAVARC